MSRFNRNSFVLAFLVFALLAFGAYSQMTQAAPGPAQSQLSGHDTITKQTLLASGTLAAGANTPVVGAWTCISSNYDQFGFQLVGPVGTMTGTGPTLAVSIDNSIDRGTSVAYNIAFTTINATVTPASEYKAFADVALSTAVTTGECWRARYTAGGTTPGGTLSVKMVGKDNQPNV